MNYLTNIKNTQKATRREIESGLSESASWHAKYKHSAYVFVGGLDFELTEGDLLAVFAQYGEIVDVNLVRDQDTGKPRGFAFLAYEDQRSTNLAVDNLSGSKVAGRIIRVEHVDNYRKKKAELEGVEEEDGNPDNNKAGVDADRWANDKHNDKPARAQGLPGPLPPPPPRPPPSSSDPWAAPGSIFALMKEAEGLAKQKDTSAGRHRDDEHSGKKHKKEKKKKDKHKKKGKRDSDRGRSSSDSDSDGRPDDDRGGKGRPAAAGFGPPRPEQRHASSFGPPKPPGEMSRRDSHAEAGRGPPRDDRDRDRVQDFRAEQRPGSSGPQMYRDREGSDQRNRDRYQEDRGRDYSDRPPGRGNDGQPSSRDRGQSPRDRSGELYRGRDRRRSRSRSRSPRR